MAIIQFENGVKVNFEGNPTPQDVEEVANRIGINKSQGTSNLGTQEQGKSFFQEVGEDLKQRGKNIAETLTSPESLKQDPVSRGLQAVGQAAGAVGDVAARTVFGVAKALTPQPVEEAAKKFGKNLMNTPAGQSALAAARQGMESYQKFKQAHPTIAKNVEAVVNIASLFPVERGAQVAGRTVFGTAKAGAEAVGEGARAVTNFGRRAASRAADVITPIERGVETTLKPVTNIGRTAERVSRVEAEQRLGSVTQKFEKYATQAEKAISDYSQSTPLELAGNEAENALLSINGKLKSIGESKRALTQTLANKDTGSIAEQARQDIRRGLRERVGVTFKQDGTVINAPGRTSAISDPSDIKLLQQVDEKLMAVSKKPTFQRVDDAIDYTQDLLFKRKSNVAVPVNDKVESVIKGAIKSLNEKMKVMGGKTYRELNNAYSYHVGVRDTLNKSLGIDANKGAALMKQLFSPSGSMPRKLFAEIKKITGIDLVEEATIAKFAMENIGDVRQASLLEQVLRGQVSPTKFGLIKYAAERFGLGKRPIEKARRILESEKKLLNE